MAKTELKLKTKNAGTGQNITTTIGYVNPTADSQTLKTFGQKLNALTTNTYEETDRVQTINVDTEQVVLPKEDQTIEIGAWTTKTTTSGHSYKVASIQAQGTVAVVARLRNSNAIAAGVGQGAGDESIISAGEIYVQSFGSAVDVTIVASGNSEYNGSSLTTTIQ